MYRSQFEPRALRLYSLPALITCVFIVYIAYVTRTYYWDGILFSLNIESVYNGQLPAAALFHPNHLLYTALGFLLYGAAQSLGLHLRAVTILQLANVFVSCGTLYVIYLLARRLTQSSSVSFFCSLLFAAGATWWKFSTDADSYIISVFLITLTFLSLIRPRQNAVAAATFHCLAMLFHELAVFMYVPVIRAIASDRQRSITRRWFTCAAYVAGTGAAVTIAYLLFYSRADHKVYPTLTSWITSYASSSGFSYSLGQIAVPYLTNCAKLFIGGRLSLMGHYVSAAMCIALAICAIAVVGCIILWRRAVSNAPESNTTKDIVDGRAVSLVWLWFVTYAVFLAFWIPGSAFYKLFTWPAIVLLIGIYVAKRPTAAGHVNALVSLAIAIAAWNFAAFVYPHSHATADPVLTLAERVNIELPKPATIYFSSFDPDDWYLAYFAPGRTWVPLPAKSAPIVQQTTNPPGGPVCFETTALDSHPVLASHIDSTRRWYLLTPQHHIKLACLKR